MNEAAMEQRISLVTLGCRDPEACAAFYDAMGWTRAETLQGMVVYQLLGQAIALYDRADLARDMGVDEGDLGTGAATYAHNVPTREDVDALVARAEAAGGRVLRRASEVFWGGYIAYVADPEGHVWEFAHNPMSPLGSDGAFTWGSGD